MSNEQPHANEVIQPHPGRWVALASCLLTVLWLTPLNPGMPVSGVDGSWAYAMNVAVDEGLRFGSDIVFTFGPLAAVYTGVYHPATDAWMLAVSVLIALAMFAGFAALVAPDRRRQLLWVPLVVGMIWSSEWDGWRDAVLLFVPLLLAWTVDAGNRRNRPFTATVVLLSCAVGVLPLVKGNFTLMVALAVFVSVALIWPASRRTALLVAVVPLLSLMVTWLVLGQSPGDLPVYFAAQAPLISGYTDAMSVAGLGRDIAVFSIAAALILAISTISVRGRRALLPLLLAAYLFVTFKSGFVRHDEQHAVVAAAALLLVGLLVHLGPGFGAGRGPVALFIGAVGFGVISMAYVPLVGSQAASRIAALLREPAIGLWDRLVHADALPTRFRVETARLAARPPFSAHDGPADVYPWDLAPLIAANERWMPRPVVQSYAAITPALVGRNARHLAEHGPERVYLAVSPIDHRYPTLEDGASWLSLLGSYTPVENVAGYVVLARNNAGRNALVPNPAVAIDARLGEDVTVVGSAHPVWVTVDVRPTLLGRIATTLYKSPSLSLTVRYANGDSADYRLVAGMARSGFLLSPTVSSADDYIALGSSKRSALLDGRRVVKMGISGERGTRWLWDLNYRVTFARLDVPASEEADQALLGREQAAAAPDTYRQGGHCSIDEADGQPVTIEAVSVSGGVAKIRGWAALDGPQGQPSQTVALLVGSDGRWKTISTVGTARPDVAAYFQQSRLEYAGFEAHLDMSKLPDTFEVRVVQQDGAGTILCPTARVTLQRAGIPSGSPGVP